MNWANKRQFIIFGIVAVVVLVLALFYIVPRATRAPTCFDNKQNGNETGVDSGGDCPRFSPEEINEIGILWSRAFETTPNIFNVVAFIENRNPDGIVFEVPYVFKIFDKDNVFIADREGTTFIEPNKRSAIFEGNIDVGNRVPFRATFSFLESPQWIRVDRQILEDILIVVQDETLINTFTSPKLSATLTNNSLYNIPKLEVVAIIFDADDNAIAVSKTFVDVLKKKKSQKVFFTWPQPFEDTAVRIELIPRINIFEIDF
ncbi:hypothetical protein COB64_03475 [Candidatus Wolfebacteria bacterium]|nr:MAG: hypothetical protein COB64_03475 [Candidatus Wolfebacteria bacterium]